MGDPFALFGTSRLVLGRGVIEGGCVDFLGVRWQMCPNRGREIFNRWIWQALFLRLQDRCRETIELTDEAKLIQNKPRCLKPAREVGKRR